MLKNVVQYNMLYYETCMISSAGKWTWAYTGTNNVWICSWAYILSHARKVGSPSKAAAGARTRDTHRPLACELGGLFLQWSVGVYSRFPAFTKAICFARYARNCSLKV